MKDFRAFILRGNVIDLAIGVAIGAAFGTVVASFTKNLITPLLAIPGDKASFADRTLTLGGSVFRYGVVIDDVISLVLIAAVLFFFVVRPVNHLMSRRRTEPDVEATTRDCPECLSSIPVAAKRCAFCTARLTKAA
ncbi:MAG TPA: large conductance mechanosensitive channel protein MscL [Acidimicrobiales bacterium]|nr:large conductance mechanosensitive channel protein MscL [Acidimicrobiales bacterium]